MKKLFIALITVLIVSCSGNSTYFDLERDSIISCHESLISKVMIKGVGDNHDFYHFGLKESRNGIGVKFFNVIDINQTFIITDKFDKVIERSKFKLKPSSKYQISNISKGDSPERWITFSTNENGYIADADVLDCN